MGCVKIFVLFIVHVYGHEHVHGADEFHLLLGVTPRPGPLGPDIYIQKDGYSKMVLMLSGGLPMAYLPLYSTMGLSINPGFSVISLSQSGRDLSSFLFKPSSLKSLSLVRINSNGSKFNPLQISSSLLAEGGSLRYSITL